MNAAQIKRGLLFLTTNGWVRLAHGELPQADAFVSEAAWQSNVWNPRGVGHDPNASRKPTWAEIEKAAGLAIQYDAVSVFRAAARAETQRRICDVYGVDNVTDEILMRLRGKGHIRQDARRDALRARYRALMNSAAPYTLPFDASMLDSDSGR